MTDLATDRTGLAPERTDPHLSPIELLAEEWLSEAYELVLAGWCQGAAAVNEMGTSIEPWSAFARRWSAAGALERLRERASDDAETALEAFLRAHLALAAAVRSNPKDWNDAPGRRQEQVAEALLRAVSLVRSPEPPRRAGA